MTKLRIATCLLFTLAAFEGAEAQEIAVDVRRDQAAAAVRLALPYPELKGEVTRESIDSPFFTPLNSDLAFAGIFALVALPPNTMPSVEIAQNAGAQALLRITVGIETGEFVFEARLVDVTTRTMLMGRRYRGSQAALTRIAHTVANDLVQYFNGTPGIFLSQIAFISTRSGNKEVHLMDYDGLNQRRVTQHQSLTLNPEWAPDNERLAYTSWSKGVSSLHLINRRGGGRIRINTGVGLNTSPTFSQDGRDIAFVGSVSGNPDIYVIRDDGTSLRRLTTTNSIESTPSWSPTGRQIAFTSSRNGTPQIYVMDAEGSNVRRISFQGDWNDDATWSPTGDLLAYTSRLEGRFQIRIMNLATMESSVLAGMGSNEQPCWSPDGRSIVFTSNRTGRWQIYRIGIDGTGLTQLTTEGDNTAPDWSKKLEGRT